MSINASKNSLTNDEIYRRCFDWREHCRDNRTAIINMLSQEAMPMLEALEITADYVLFDMGGLVQMEQAGLGYLAFPQVRSLFEAAVVASCMQTLNDKVLAGRVIRASEGENVFYSESNRSIQRLDTYWREKGYAEIGKSMKRRFRIYNAYCHFNQDGRPNPDNEEQNRGIVQTGLALGYMSINEFALFLSRYIGETQKAASTRAIEARLDECGEILLCSPAKI